MPTQKFFGHPHQLRLRTFHELSIIVLLVAPPVLILLLYLPAHPDAQLRRHGELALVERDKHIRAEKETVLCVVRALQRDGTQICAETTDSHGL